MLIRFRVLMHSMGEILLAGEVDEDDLHDAIRKHAPAALGENPGVIVAKAVLSGGSLSHEGWSLEVERIPLFES